MFKVKEGQIRPRGLFFVLVIMLITKLFLGVPRTMVNEGASAAWLLILLSAIAASVGVFLLLALLKRFPGKNLVEIADSVWGRPGSYLVAIVLSMAALFLASVVVREFGETMLTTVLPQTPISVIIMFFLIAMLVGAYNGLEVITRASTLLFPFVVMGILSILMLTGNHINLTNLFPLLGSGIGQIAYHVPGRTSLFMEIIFVGLIAGNISDKKNMPGWIWAGFIFSTLLFLIIELFYVSVLRVEAAEKLYVPLYQLARIIYMGRFIQRIEALYIFVWFFIGALKLTLILYSSAMALSQGFRIPIYQPLLFPLSLLVFALSFAPGDIVEAVKLDMEIIREYGAILSWGLPGALLLTAVIRGKRGDKSEAAKTK